MKKALMCSPDHFEVVYSINPWMKGEKVDSGKAFQEWEYLKNILEESSVEVSVIEQTKNQPDMVFAADQAIYRDGSAIISNFKYSERQGESKLYKSWLENKGYKTKNLPGEICFEGGGESAWLGDRLLIGAGFRTSMTACKHIGEILDVETSCLELINPKFYHLDTCLFVLNQDTVFYYPPAFGRTAIEKIKRITKNLYEFSLEEVENFAANSVVVGDIVIVQKGSPRFQSKLQELGYIVKEVDVSEFIKAGGGAHCLVGAID